MQLLKATRQRAKIKMNIQGPSGSGKTYSALLLASGITTWDKIAVIDSENKSANLYAHLGDYSVLPLPDYSPKTYAKAIQKCEDEGIEVVIIDSITHEWEWILAYMDSMQGNSYTNWAKATPVHNAFVRSMLDCNMHVIATSRSKQDYVLEENSKGKMEPRKVGMKAVQREGLDYEFTLVFDLDINHNAKSSKDRTSIFTGELSAPITPVTGKKILEWCNNGTAYEKKLPQMTQNQFDQFIIRLAKGDNVEGFAREKFSFTNLQEMKIEEIKQNLAG